MAGTTILSIALITIMGRLISGHNHVAVMHALYLLCALLPVRGGNTRNRILQWE